MSNRLMKNDTILSQSDARTQQEYSRILTAAVINLQFRQLLLSNPAKAIDAGYCGESFQLAREEKKRLASIRATTLADFATQLRQALDYGAPAHAGD